MFYELLKLAITDVAAKKQPDLVLKIIKLGQLFKALDYKHYGQEQNNNCFFVLFFLSFTP